MAQKKEEKEAKTAEESSAKEAKGKELTIEAKIAEEARSLGVKRSRVRLTGFKGKEDPVKLAKEQARQEKLADDRVEKRIARAKATANMKPIDKRRALLEARFKNVKSRTRESAYSDDNIKAWIEEWNLIKTNPKAWNIATKNGTVPYSPGSKRKKSAQDILSGMDLE